VDQEALMAYASQAANFATHYQVSTESDEGDKHLEPWPISKLETLTLEIVKLTLTVQSNLNKI